MPALLRATRIAALATAILAAGAPLAMHARAQALPPGVGPTSTSPTPAPTPTPCPNDPTGILCQAAGGPPPAAPTPSPTPTPKPAPPPPSNGGGAPASTPPPPAAPGGAAGPATPGAVPPPGAPPAAGAAAAVVAQVAATFKNAPFLGQLLQILNHPTAAQRPDLHHFRPNGGGGPGGGHIGPSGGGAAATTGSASRPSLFASIALGTLGMLLAMVAALLIGSAPARLWVRRRLAAVWHLHPSLHPVAIGLHNLAVSLHSLWRLVRDHLAIPRLAMRRHSSRGLTASGLVAALPALVLAVVLGGADRSATPLTAASPPSMSSYLRSEIALGDVLPAAAPVAPPTWTRLVTIERGLAGQQDELAAQEAAIARLAVNLGGSSPDDEDSIQVGPDSRTQLRNRLTQLVAAHTATQANYQQSLQAEYDLYRAAAQNPAQRDQLTAAATAQQPQAKEAVVYNLSLVQTQLSQEAVIAQAEGQLAQLGSLGAAQLDAMRHHQPFIAPMVAPVTQTFGPTDFSLEPPLSYNGTFYPHFHTGLDLGAPLDTPIHAAADGVVLLAAASVDETGKLVGYGNYVVIAHPDGFVTLYGHLDTTAVKAGQVIHQGEIIGQEGSTGWSTGPHVHFEIRHNGQFLDPAPFLAGQLPPS